VRLVDSGFRIELHGLKASPVFNDYRNLVHETTIDSGLRQGLAFAAESIIAAWRRGSPASPGGDALAAQRVCFSILKEDT